MCFSIILYLYCYQLWWIKIFKCMSSSSSSSSSSTVVVWACSFLVANEHEKVSSYSLSFPLALVQRIPKAAPAVKEFLNILTPANMSVDHRFSNSARILTWYVLHIVQCPLAQAKFFKGGVLLADRMKRCGRSRPWIRHWNNSNNRVFNVKLRFKFSLDKLNNSYVWMLQRISQSIWFYSSSVSLVWVWGAPTLRTLDTDEPPTPRLIKPLPQVLVKH